MTDPDKAEIIKLIMDVLEKNDDSTTFRMAREIFYRVFLPVLQREKIEADILNKIRKKPKSSSH